MAESLTDIRDPNEPWAIQLLGELRATRGNRTVTRFPTQRVGALLAYLAYHRHRSHPREELIELLWPETEPESGRTSLRTALASLRRLLEPPDLSPGTVLAADRFTVRLQPERITTDVAQFEQALGAAATLTPVEQTPLLEEAVALYHGELLPGYHEVWIANERLRLSEAYAAALRELAGRLSQQGNHRSAIDYALRAVQVNLLDEEAHAALIRLYVAAGQTSAAQRQYQELERVLNAELGARPTRSLESFLREGTAQQPLQTAGLGEPEEEAAPSAEAAGGTRRNLRRRSASGERGRREVELPRGAPPGAPLARRRTGHGARPPVPPSGDRDSQRSAGGLPPLPTPPTPFHGREEEIAQISAILEQPSVRLVTLTGLGGTGKTRLALQVARALRDSGARTVAFVSLAEVTEPAVVADGGEGVRRQIGAAVRAALRLPAPGPAELGQTLEADPGPMEQIATALADRPFLLVLDNFEQLLAHGPEFVRELVDRSPQLQCLVTSRRTLGLSMEHEYPVGPLPTPTAPATPERLREYASVRLFVGRAQMARPDFEVTPGNAQAVAQLCHALEGIPLALELAAARAQVLTPQQMLQHLAHRFDFLVGRHRDVAERHRTLRAALEWSYRSLPDSHRRLLAQLSVFRGGCTLAAAQSVCGDEQPLDRLIDLREASLVTSDPVGEEMRFRLLETVREYAVEQLDTAELARLEERHATFFCRLAEEAAPALDGPAQREWLERLEPERDNLRAALQWAAEAPPDARPEWVQRRLETGLRLAVALETFWLMRGDLFEARRQLELLLEGSAGWLALAASAARAQALVTAGTLAYRQTDLKAARAQYEAGLAVWRALGDPRGLATALTGLAAALREQGDLRAAQSRLHEALGLWKALGDSRGLTQLCMDLGRLAYQRGDYQEAARLYRESLALRRPQGDRWRLAETLVGLAAAARVQGDRVACRPLYEEALEIRREFGDRWGEAESLNQLGALATVEDLERARSFHEEALAIYRGLGSRPHIVRTLCHLALVERFLGDYSAVRQHSEEALKLGREVEDWVSVTRSLTALGVASERQGEYDEARAHLEAAMAIWRERGPRVGLPWGLTHLGEVARAQARLEEAGERFQESLSLVRELADGWHLSYLLNAMALLALAEGEPARARTYLEESLQLARVQADPGLIAGATHTLGRVFLAQGEPTAARMLIEESLSLWQEWGAAPGIAAAHSALGQTARSVGELDQARCSLMESLALYGRLGEPRAVAGCLEGLAQVAASAAPDEASAARWAVRLFAAAEAVRAGIGAPLPPPAEHEREQQLAVLRAALGEAVFSAAWDAGGRLTWEQVAGAEGQERGAEEDSSPTG